MDNNLENNSSILLCSSSLSASEEENQFKERLQGSLKKIQELSIRHFQIKKKYALSFSCKPSKNQTQREALLEAEGLKLWHNLKFVKSVLENINEPNSSMSMRFFKKMFPLKLLNSAKDVSFDFKISLMGHAIGFLEEKVSNFEVNVKSWKRNRKKMSRDIVEPLSNDSLTDGICADESNSAEVPPSSLKEDSVKNIRQDKIIKKSKVKHRKSSLHLPQRNLPAVEEQQFGSNLELKQSADRSDQNAVDKPEKLNYIKQRTKSIQTEGYKRPCAVSEVFEALRKIGGDFIKNETYLSNESIFLQRQRIHVSRADVRTGTGLGEYQDLRGLFNVKSFLRGQPYFTLSKYRKHPFHSVPARRKNLKAKMTQRLDVLCLPSTFRSKTTLERAEEEDTALEGGVLVRLSQEGSLGGGIRIDYSQSPARAGTIVLKDFDTEQGCLIASRIVGSLVSLPSFHA